MHGGGDVDGWVVEHVIAKVEGEALARIKGEEYSRKRYTKPRQFLSDIGTEIGMAGFGWGNFDAKRKLL